MRADELALYSGQYRHAVVALADLAATGGDTEHAREERRHVDLWDDFVAACGGEAAEPLPETRELVATLRASAPGAETDAVLYALEASQPAVSETKLPGSSATTGSRPTTRARRTSASTPSSTRSTLPRQPGGFRT